jgi:hypothetical protein
VHFLGRFAKMQEPRSGAEDPELTDGRVFHQNS